MAILATGVWALLIAVVMKPGATFALHKFDHFTKDIEIETAIKSIIENCKVTGRVYIYDKNSGYGEIEHGRIKC